MTDLKQVREWLDNNGPLSVEEFKRAFNPQLFRHDGQTLINEGRILGVPAPVQRRRRFTTKRRTVAMTIFRRVPDAEYVQVTRRGKVDVVYFKDKRGQLHKRGKNGQFLHFTKAESRQIHRGVKHRRPSQAKKGQGE